MKSANLGFEASPLGDNLGEWEVRLTSVPRNEQLWKDLQGVSLVSRPLRRPTTFAQTCNRRWAAPQTDSRRRTSS